jgi:hypothetical protein
MVDLAVESEVYGLSLFGDGATVHGMPLMNILASGVGEPCAVLSIVDCKFCFSVANFPILTSALTKIVVAVSCFTHRYRSSRRWRQKKCHVHCVLVRSVDKEAGSS